MKRGAGPERRTRLTARIGLARTTGLDRGTPLGRATSELTRSSSLSRSVPMPRAPHPGTAPRRAQRPTPAAPTAILRLVRARDLGCVACGRENLPLETHHRRRKGMGGSKLLDVPSNLVRLCGHGNVDGCHGLAHQHRIRAEASGWCVPDGTAPAAWPVRHALLGWVLLDDQGGWTATEPPRELDMPDTTRGAPGHDQPEEGR